MSVSWGGAIMRWRPLWGINMRGLQRRQIFHNSFICREPLQSVGNHREDCNGKSGSFCRRQQHANTEARWWKENCRSFYQMASCSKHWGETTYNSLGVRKMSQNQKSWIGCKVEMKTQTIDHKKSALVKRGFKLQVDDNLWYGKLITMEMDQCR